MNRENIYQTLNQKEILETQELKAFIYRILKLIEEDIDTFTMTKDYTYFLLTIPYLYKISTFNDSEKKNITLKLQSIRGKIQKILKEKKVNNETKNNYKILKKFNGKIEIVSLSLINSYDENFQEYKQDLIYYLIFSIKNIQVLKNILKKAPHQINILDKNGLLIIEKVVDSFLESLLYHVKEEDYKNLDDVIYYDRVLEILLTHNKEYINKYHIKKIDLVFQKAQQNSPKSIILQERYLYFIYKWREIFQKYLGNFNDKINFNEKYSNKQLEAEYMIKKKFDPLYNTIARTLIYQTKFPKVKSYMPNVYTVDKKGSLELDDGFSCTKSNGIYHLGIHITNPMATLKEENLLFQNACQRVSSVYLKNLMIPMFPHELATGLFSLNEGNVRHALNAFIDIDLAKKEISKFEIILAPVYVRKNDTYTNCNTVINKKIGEQEYIETLKNIQEIMPLLKETYKIDKLYASINRTEQNATATNIVGKTKSEQMIETLMVFMNYMYSKYAMTHSIPILYRNHERYPFYKEELATYEKMLKSSKNDEIYKNEIKILTSNYPRSFYAINNIGHFGLGLPSYTHITSPDRRIADCINILMFQKYQNEETLKKGKQLLSLAQYINERNHSISNFVMEYSLKKK